MSDSHAPGKVHKYNCRQLMILVGISATRGSNSDTFIYNMRKTTNSTEMNRAVGFKLFFFVFFREPENDRCRTDMPGRYLSCDWTSFSFIGMQSKALIDTKSPCYILFVVRLWLVLRCYSEGYQHMNLLFYFKNIIHDVIYRCVWGGLDAACLGVHVGRSKACQQ